MLRAHPALSWPLMRCWLVHVLLLLMHVSAGAQTKGSAFTGDDKVRMLLPVSRELVPLCAWSQSLKDGMMSPHRTFSYSEWALARSSLPLRKRFWA